MKRAYDFAGETNPFNDAAAARPSMVEADEAVFGKIRQVDERRRVANPIDIFHIFPDYSQPRRAIPSHIRQHWDRRPETTTDLFRVWLHAVALEWFDAHAHGDVDALLEQAYETVDAILNGRPTRRAAEAEVEAPRHALPETPGISEAALLQIVDLAASIRRDGLTNPVTVARVGSDYRLETGERRWLAYHLLYAHFQDEAWRTIPARLVEKVDVWRQASENNARDDLNAIGKARQFALLLMDLYRGQNVEFASYDALARGGGDRPFYAQVEDGAAFRVPRGKGEMLLNAMGLKHAKQLRDYRALLRLPDDLWQVADDLNWAERFIRDLRAQAVDEAEFHRLLWLEAQKAGYTAPMGAVYGETEAQKAGYTAPMGAVGEGRPLAGGAARRRMQRLLKLDDAIFAADKTERLAVLKMIEDHRRWLDTLEDELLNSLNE